MSPVVVVVVIVVFIFLSFTRILLRYLEHYEPVYARVSDDSWQDTSEV